MRAAGRHRSRDRNRHALRINTARVVDIAVALVAGVVVTTGIAIAVMFLAAGYLYR